MCISKKRTGYSLVELVVAVGIFSIAFVTISAIFLGFTVAQSRAGQAQRLLNEGNFLFESVAREIRIDAINYAAYDSNGICVTTISDKTKNICLKTSDGKDVRIVVTGSVGAYQVQVCKRTDFLLCGSLGVDPNWKTLSPTFLTIDYFSFNLFPTSDPTGSGTLASFNNTFQPMVMLNFGMETGRGRGKQVYNLQTTVSSRLYKF